jgi:hypothetical protein
MVRYELADDGFISNSNVNPFDARFNVSVELKAYVLDANVIFGEGLEEYVPPFEMVKFMLPPGDISVNVVPVPEYEIGFEKSQYEIRFERTYVC